MDPHPLGAYTPGFNSFTGRQEFIEGVPQNEDVRFLSICEARDPMNPSTPWKLTNKKREGNDFKRNHHLVIFKLAPGIKLREGTSIVVNQIYDFLTTHRNNYRENFHFEFYPWFCNVSMSQVFFDSDVFDLFNKITPFDNQQDLQDVLDDEDAWKNIVFEENGASNDFQRLYERYHIED